MIGWEEFLSLLLLKFWMLLKNAWFWGVSSGLELVKKARDHLETSPLPDQSAGRIHGGNHQINQKYRDRQIARVSGVRDLRVFGNALQMRGCDFLF